MRAGAQQRVGHACRADIHCGVLGEVQRPWKAHAECVGVAEARRAAVYSELVREAVDQF